MSGDFFGFACILQEQNVNDETGKPKDGIGDEGDYCFGKLAFVGCKFTLKVAALHPSCAAITGCGEIFVHCRLSAFELQVTTLYFYNVYSILRVRNVFKTKFV